MTLAHRKFAYLQLSDQANADLYRHFISEDNPNKRLFERYESASKDIINGVFRLLFVVSGDDQFYDQILPNLKEPLVKKMEHENILRLIWQRKNIKFTRSLLKTINERDKGALSHFIAGGPKNTDKIPQGSQFAITDKAFDYIVSQFNEGNLDIRPINRLCMIIENYQEKYPAGSYDLLYQKAQTSFTSISTFKPK